MARTLFFVEVLLFAALSAAFPIFASRAAIALAIAFALPAAVSLVLPLAAAMAVWEPREVLHALASAFSREGSGAAAGRHAAILGEMGAFSRLAAALGFILCLSSGAGPLGPAGWGYLGLYLAAYALLNATLWRVLGSAVAGRDSPNAAAIEEAPPACPRAGFIEEHRITPREAETAIRIASGMSYKETAFELGISIRTVKAHMSSVYAKTGAASNVALALLMRGEEPPTTKVQ